MGQMAGSARKLNPTPVMRSVLFDDRGEMWDARSRDLADVLNASIAGEELADYAIRNLGYIGAKEGDGSARISLRPAVVSPIAFSALVYWLCDREFDRVLLSFFDRAWSYEMLRSGQEAVRKLMTRVDLSPDNRLGDFLQQPLPLQNLSPPMQSVLAAWSELRGKFDRERLRPLLQSVLQGRFVLAEAQESSGMLLLKDVGPGLAKRSGLERAVGLRVEDQPDHAYGKWTAQLYRQVLDSREPSLSEVDAVISWPQAARERYRYRRLIVPFENTNDSTILLVASLADPAIDLRVKPR
jgi:hypothetical protein